MEDVLIADDDSGVFRLLRDLDGPDCVMRCTEEKYPEMLMARPHAAAFAAFFGSIKCVRLFINLSFNHQHVDAEDRPITDFAAAGGSFDICREFQNLGVAFRPASAECAVEFGRLDILQWLWTLGHCESRAVQWQCLRLAVKGGHVEVVKFLVSKDGFKLGPGKREVDPREMSKWIGGGRNNFKVNSALAGALTLAASRGFVDIVKTILDVGGHPLGAAAAAAFGGFVEIVDLVVERFPDELECWMIVEEARGFRPSGIIALDCGLNPLEAFVAGGFAIPARFESLTDGGWREGELRMITKFGSPLVVERLIAFKDQTGLFEAAIGMWDVLQKSPKIAALVLRGPITNRDARAAALLHGEYCHLVLRALAVIGREDPSLVAGFRAIVTDFAVLSTALKCVRLAARSVDDTLEVIDDFVVLFGEDWSGVEGSSICAWNSSRIRRRLIALHLGMKYEMRDFPRGGRHPTISAVHEAAWRRDEELLEICECVLADGWDFRRHSFDFDVLSKAPRSAIFLIDHGAMLVPFGNRSGRKEKSPAEIAQAIEFARARVNAV
jgi:hypothetical protein